MGTLVLKGLGIRSLLGMILAALGIGILAFYGLDASVEGNGIDLVDQGSVESPFELINLIGIGTGVIFLIGGLIITFKSEKPR